MVQSSVVWIDARKTIPVGIRDVLIVISPSMKVQIGHYNRGEWLPRIDPEEGAIMYWADLPDAPLPRDRG